MHICVGKVRLHKLRVGGDTVRLPNLLHLLLHDLVLVDHLLVVGDGRLSVLCLRGDVYFGLLLCQSNLLGSALV